MELRKHFGQSARLLMVLEWRSRKNFLTRFELGTSCLGVLRARTYERGEALGFSLRTLMNDELCHANLSIVLHRSALGVHSA